MDLRTGLIILFVFGASWACESRELGTTSSFTGMSDKSEELVLQVHNPDSEQETQAVGDQGKKENVCTLCEEFTTEALNYLAANKTQTEIVNTLHKACSKMHSFKPECITLVDYYAPLFFVEVSSIQPGDFCQKVNLCEKVAIISQRFKKSSCEFCQETVSEVLIRLEDPDTQLEIIEVLLKACKAMKGFEKKCKRVVFEYGPIILANAEHLLESNDICTELHACTSPKQAFTAKRMVATS